jgi:MFS family permease
MLVHLIPHLTENMGYTLTAAGTLVALMTGCQFGGQFLGGYLGDLLNKRWLCVACMLAHGSGMLLLIYADSLWLAMLSVILHGLAWGVRGPLMSALRADYFGSRSFGTIIGISSLVVMLGMMGGPLISGLLADIYGNYDIAFSVIAVATLAGSFCFWAATPPKDIEN